MKMIKPLTLYCEIPEDEIEEKEVINGSGKIRIKRNIIVGGELHEKANEWLKEIFEVMKKSEIKE